MISSEHSAAAARVAELLAAKAIVGAVREYQVALEGAANRGLSRGGNQRSLAADHRGWLREFAPLAFAEGLRAGGVDEFPDEEDEEVIRAWIAEQVTHVSSFWSDVLATRKLDPPDRATAERHIIVRVGYWVAAMESLRALGRASAQRNMMVTWRLGATEDHCETCASLNGKRRRWKWFTARGYIPREPGSDTLECKGYRCECSLRDDKGKQVMP